MAEGDSAWDFGLLQSAPVSGWGEASRAFRPWLFRER